jgi:hypothetical protein
MTVKEGVVGTAEAVGIGLQSGRALLEVLPGTESGRGSPPYQVPWPKGT